MPLAYIKFLTGAGAKPEHPIVIPPDSIAPGVPTHPIVIPPEVSHPIVIPPGSIAPGVPSQPIYIPGVPDNTLPGQPPAPDNTLPGSQPHPDQGLPGSQPGPDNTLPGVPVIPSHPIALPPLPKDLQEGEVVVLTYTQEGTAAWTIFNKDSAPRPDNSLPAGSKRK